MNMNFNPWIIEALVEYEKDRIQRGMKQIRLEEEAIQAGRVVENITKTRLFPLRLLMRIVPSFIKWIFAWVGRFIAAPPKSNSEYRARG